MEILTHYLEILKVRFPENLEIVENIADDVKDLKMPAMVLQPLIENSINYGYANSTSPLIIEINITKDAEFLIIKVRNNGPIIDHFNPKKQTGVGLTNLTQRLENLYGTTASFTLKNWDQGIGVENIIKIPIIPG